MNAAKTKARQKSVAGATAVPPQASATIWHFREGLLLVLLALGLRLAYVYETSAEPTVRHLVGDAAGYYQWAQHIAAGDWWGTESFYQAPLYPYVLAVWFKIAGDDIWKLRCLQSAWGAVAVLLLYSGTQMRSGKRIALFAAMLLALYPPAIFFDGLVQKASMDGFLVCAIIAALAHFSRSPNARRAILIGCLLGLMSLSRENALIWVPLLATWCWLGPGHSSTASRNVAQQMGDMGRLGLPVRDPASQAADARPWRPQKLENLGGNDAGKRLSRQGIVQLVAFVFGLGVVLAPVGLRNLFVGGEWSISTFQAGPNLYIGNHRGAPGYYAPLVRGHETPFHERADATRLAQQVAGRELSPREVSHFWMRRAWSEITDAPGEWSALLWRKFLLLLNRYEITDVESLNVYRDNSLVLSGLRFLHWGTITPLALLGMWTTRRRWRDFWILYAMIASMAIAIVAFYIMARYRFPLVPLLMPFAAAAVMRLYDWIREGSARTRLTSSAALVALAIPINWPLHDEARLNALARMNVGVALAQAGEIAEATEYFRAAVAQHPGSAEAHNNLAQALAVQERYAEAVQHYRAALGLADAGAGDAGSDRAAGLPGVWYNLGVALENLGRHAEALEAYRAAVLEDPGDEEAVAGVGRLADEPR